MTMVTVTFPARVVTPGGRTRVTDCVYVPKTPFRNTGEVDTEFDPVEEILRPGDLDRQR